MSGKKRKKSDLRDSGDDSPRVPPPQYPAWNPPPATTPPRHDAPADASEKPDVRIHKFAWLITALIGAAVGFGGSYLSFLQNSSATRETNRIRVEEMRKSNDLKRFELINQLLSRLSADTAQTRQYTIEAIRQLGIDPAQVRAPVTTADSAAQPGGELVGVFRDLEGQLWAGGPCSTGQRCGRIILQ
ncbi:MAG TPA: hypothetical protein VFJ82_11420 [Longimicrobium sp.]|nr:hypothetical protein [Longimicrobium sp.]